MDRGNEVLDGSRGAEGRCRDHQFGTQFAITDFVGYNLHSPT